MRDEKVESDKNGKDEAARMPYPVDSSTEQETQDRERMRREEEQKHHEQIGS